MSTEDEKLEQTQMKLEATKARLAQLKTATEKLEHEVNPPRPAIDHAADGGII